MVAVKKPDCAIDLKTDALKVAVEGDYIYAENTSLGKIEWMPTRFFLIRT